MRRFTQLILKLNDLHTEPEIVKLLETYFREVPHHDGSWALWLLLGNKLRPVIKKATLQQWIADKTGYPDWLIKESSRHVGNIAETFSLLVGNQSINPGRIALGTLMEESLLPLKDWDSYFQRQMLEELWQQTRPEEQFILTQILSGSMRTNCSYFLVVRALANALELDFPVLLYRLQQHWQPGKSHFKSLADPSENRLASELCPYPSREPGSLHASLILVYAYVLGFGDQAGFSTYALAAVSGSDLIPVARIPSTLEAADKALLDEWIRENTIAKKGPVRTTPAELVFRIGFDGAYASRRHKCGLVLDNPIMLSWQKHASLEQVTGFKELQSLVNQEAPLT